MKKGFLSFWLLTAVVLTGGCKIGLGEAVDTEAPELELTTPAAGAIIRDTFALSGTWSDDGEIKEGGLTAVLTRTDETGSPITYSGTLDKDSGTWKCVIDPKATDKSVLDGEYEAVVTLTDTYEHKTIKSVTFTVDNTAPIIVLQRPSAKSTDSSPDSYGQSFTLEGQAADDNDVSLVEIQIFSDPECTLQIHKVQLNNVPPAISLDVAKFVEGEENDYSKIYGSTSKDGTKQFYCKIVAYDGAKRYPIDGTNQTLADSYGNSTNFYYLYDEISSSILNTYKITEVYHMLSGTYTNADASARSATINSVKDTLSKNIISTGTFTLNPANNPTFTVSGKQLETGKKNFEDSNYDITNGSAVVIEVAPGLDGIALDRDSLKPYGIQCDEDGNVISDAQKIYMKTVTATKNGTSQKFVAVITKADGFVIGQNYLFGVDGKDQSDNIVVENGNPYGFHLASSGSAPSLTVTAPAGSMVYLKKGDKLTVSGSTETEEGAPVVSILYGDTVVATKTFTESEATVVNSSNHYDFNFTGDSGIYNIFSQTQSDQYALSIKSSDNGLSTVVNKSVMYDVDGPVISAPTISPMFASYTDSNGTAHANTVNGKIIVKGSVLDDFDTVSKVSYAFIQNEQTKLSGDISAAYNFTLDTKASGVADKTPSKLVITAYDRAGNSTVYSVDLYVDQDSDKPTIGPNTASAWNASISVPYDIKYSSNSINKLSSGSALYAKITDDDGLTQVSFTVEAINAGTDYRGTTIVSPTPDYITADVGSETKTTEVAGQTEILVSHEMPKHTGYYKVTIKASDGNAANDQSISFTVLVTGTAPEVTLTNKSDYVKSGVPVSLQVIMSGQLPYTLRIWEQDGSVDADGNKAFVVKDQIVLDAQSDSSKESVNKKLTDRQLIPNGSEYTYNFKYVPVSTESRIIKVSVTDDGDGITTKQTSYKVDNKIPESPVLETPAAGVLVSVSPFVFSGTAKDSEALTGEYKSGVSKLKYAITSGSTPAATDYKEMTVSDSIKWNITQNFKNANAASTDEGLAEGSYTIYLKAVDAAGNESGETSRTFNVDLNNPTLTTAITTGTECKVKNSIYYFKGSLKVTITANDTAGSVTNTYKIDGGTPVSLGDNSGSWTIDAANFTEGKTQKLTITTTDQAGKTASAEYYVYKDETAPSLGINSYQNYYDNKDGQGVTLSGTITDFGVGPAKVQYSKTSGGTSKDVTYTAGDTSWTFTLPATDLDNEGTKNYYFKAQDALGNTTAESPVSFNFDKNAPVLTIVDSSTGTNYVKDGFTLTGTIYDTNSVDRVVIAKNDEATPSYSSKASPATVTLADVTNAKSSGTAATWSKSFAKGDLADGTYKLKVTGYDIADRASTSYTKTFVVDTVAPSIELKALPNKDSTKGTSYTFRGTGTDATSGIKEVYLTISGKDAGGNTVTKTVKVDGDSSWSYELNFTDTTTTDDTDGTANSWAEIFAVEGDKTVLVKAVDYAGNETTTFTYSGNSKSSVTFVYDKANPVLTVDTSTILEFMPQAGFTITGTASDSYKLADSNALLVTQNDGTNTYTKYITTTDGKSASTAWSVAVPFNSSGTKVDASDGTYKYTFDLVDSAGNHYSETPKEYSSVADLTKPVLTVTKPSSATGTSAISENNYKIYGTFTEDHINNIYYKVLTATDSVPSAPSTGVTTASNWTSTVGGSWSVVSAIETASWNFYQQFKAKGASGDGLAEGSYKLYLYAVDRAGNISELSTTAFDVDMAAPVVTETSLNSATSYKKREVDAKGNVIRNVVLGGKITETNGLASFEIKRNGNLVFSTSGNNLSKDSNGVDWTWSFIDTTLTADGTYNYTIEVKDVAGRSNTALSRTVIVDTTNPTADASKITVPTNLETENSLFKFVGTKDAAGACVSDTGTSPSGLDYVKIAFSKEANGTKYPTDGINVTPATDGTWSSTIEYASYSDVFGTKETPDQGDKWIWIKAYDKAGNESDWVSQTFVYDTAVPAITETGIGSDGTYKNSTFTLSGTASDTYGLSKVEIKSDKNNYTFSSDGQNPTLTFDTTNGAWSKEITLNSGNVSTNTITDGSYTFTITVTDKSGKTNQITRKFTVDTTSPVNDAENSSVGVTASKLIAKPDNGTRQEAVNATWFKNTALNFTGKFTDDTSGVDSVDYEITPANNSANKISDSMSVSGSGSTYTYSSTISGFEEGINNISLKAKDKAGNLSSALTYTINVDQTAPSIQALYYTYDDSNFTAATGSVYTNALSSMTVYGTVSDSGSGLAELTFKAGSSDIASGNVTLKYTTDVATGLTTGASFKNANWSDYTSITDKTKITAWKAEIKKDAWSSFSNSAVDLKVKATDISGNGEYQLIFAITKDQSAPTVTYTALTDADTSTNGIQINGKIILSGTADDNVKLSAVSKIQYQIVTSSSATPSVSGWSDLTVEFASNSGYSWKTKPIDTTASPFADSNTKDVWVYFRAIASDVAGNDTAHKINDGGTALESANESGTYTQLYCINQDSDRPVIHISNLNCSGMTSSNNVWHSQSTLYGTVEDDDGTVEYVKCSLDGTTWSDNLYSNGVWTYTVNANSNGAQKLYFNVKDTANTYSFISQAAYSLKAPKIQDNQTTTNKFGYKDGTKDSIVYVNFDTEPPAFGNIYFTLDSSVAATVNSSNAETLVTQNSTPTGWKTIDRIGDQYIGGTNHNIYILYACKDSNGIDASKTTETIGDGTKSASSTMIYPSTKTSTSDSSWCVQLVKIDVSSLNSGKGNRLTLKIADKSGREESKTYSTYIDMEAPAITIRSHNDGDEVYGSLPVSFNGRTQDADGQSITKLYYGLTKDATAPDASAYTAIQDYVSTMAWAISFDTAANKTPSNSTTNSTTYHANYLNKNLDTLYGTGTSTQDTTKEIYLWVYAEDSLGNSGSSSPEKVKLNVLTQPDKPSVTIDYPTNNTTVGGTIRLSGTTTIKSDSVKAVWLQIDPDYDPAEGTFSSSWNTELSTLNGTQTVGYTITTESTAATYASDETPGGSTNGLGAGIKAKGDGQSWNLSINTLSEFTQIGSGNSAKNRIVAVRAYAVSSTNKRLSNPATIYFTVDPNCPIFGDSTKGQELTLVSKDGKKQMKYSSGVWVSGEWYITGSVQHGAGIQTLTKTDSGSGQTGVSLVALGNAQTVTDVTLTKRDTDTYNTGHTAYNWNFKIPVSSASGAGSTNFTLSAVDAGNGKTADVDIYVRYDNNAPSGFTAKTDSGTLTSSGNSFKQSNGTFTIEGDVTEPGTESGFERAAFYFTRTIGTTTYIIDPMVTKDTGSGDAPDCYRNNYIKVDSDLTLADGLYWRKVTGASIDNTNKLSVSSVPDNIRIGGLCKVNNVIYRISDISGKTITLDGTFSTQTSLDVYFALAQVIDNTVTESRSKTNGTTKGTDVYESSGESSSEWTNGDGDQMVEGIRVSGETYSWQASINSKNIYDGPVKLCFAYFDAAGNGSTASYDGKVCNNAPRLASVTIGTDYDGNGTISDSEKKTKYAGDTTLTVSGVKKSTQVTNLLIASSDGTESGKSFMTLKDKSTFDVEIIGGNGKLYYSYDIKCPAGTGADGNACAAKTISGSKDPSWNGIQDNDAYTAVQSGQTYINVDSSHTKTITLSAADFDNYNGTATSPIYIPNSTSDSPTWFNYTFWDSTDGTNVNSGAVSTWTSENATIKLALEVQVHDNIKPNVVINKFHWTSATDNSLYNNSKDNGHIELEDDWKSSAGYSDSSLAESLKDADPKVSGKITFTGYAWDNIRLDSLWLNFDDFTLGTNVLSGTSPDTNRSGYKKVASYESVDSVMTWKTAAATMATDGWEFSVSATADGSYLNENGHKVMWTLSIDTSKITNAAGLDKKLSLFAADARANNLSLATAKTTAGDDSLNTPFYQMDVVPYITEITTTLSNKYKKVPSVHNRNSIGEYPVKEGESISISGFNFGTSPTVNIGSTTINCTTKTNTLISGAAIATGTASGSLTVTANGISTLNNSNSNDAKGDYTGTTTDPTGDATIYGNYYNRLPNGINNNTLTDDVTINVWKIQTAVTPVSGTVKYPTMKINPKTGMPGFSFANAVLYYSMPGTVGDDNSTVYSQAVMESSNGGFTNNTFCWDSDGYAYGAALGTDTGWSVSGASFQIFARKSPDNFGDTRNTQRTYINQLYASRLESINVCLTGTNTSAKKDPDKFTTDTDRITSPALATSRNDDITTLHVAYYDRQTKQIRYRSGKIGGTSTPSISDKDSFSLADFNYSTFAQDSYIPSAVPDSIDVDGSSSSYQESAGAIGTKVDYSNKTGNQRIEIVANNALDSTARTAYKTAVGSVGAGEYLDMGIIDSDSATPVVVIAWYDGANLQLSWEKPSDTTENNYTLLETGTVAYKGAWQKTNHITQVEEGAGRYVQLRVDPNNGVHLAYEASGDLHYAFYRWTGSALVEVTKAMVVDSYNTVGNKCSIGVSRTARTGGGYNYIPYIGYQMDVNTAKVAYPVKFQQCSGDSTIYYAAGDGAEDDMFTGNWACEIVPTTNTPENYKVSADVYTSGTNQVLTATPSNTPVSKKSMTHISGYNVCDATQVWGNGTSNPLVSYAVNENGALEMAQKN